MLWDSYEQTIWKAFHIKTTFHNNLLTVKISLMSTYPQRKRFSQIFSEVLDLCYIRTNIDKEPFSLSHTYLLGWYFDFYLKLKSSYSTIDTWLAFQLIDFLKSTDIDNQAFSINFKIDSCKFYRWTIWLFY